jgi:hypothetical protein
MRIGIITHHWVPNFGANLQVLSSSLKLSSLGHEVEVLNFINKGLLDRYEEIISSEQLTAHRKFVNDNLPLSPVLWNENELVQYCDDANFDLVISGSDAVFRLFKDGSSHEGQFPNPFWLNWTSRLKRNCKTAVLSGSCTGSMYLTFPKRLKTAIRSLISGYDYISVRDKWTRWMFRLVSGHIVRVSPDPVSILSTLIEKTQKNEKYFLLSFPERFYNKGWVKSFVKLANTNGFKVYSLPLPEKEFDWPVDHNIKLPLSPLEWYHWIANADGIIADRFHTIVSAVYNNVPFMSVDNNFSKCLKYIPLRARSKQYDLCLRFGLTNRCLTPFEFSRIRPETALKLLLNWESESISNIIERDQNHFNANITEMFKVCHV